MRYKFLSLLLEDITTNALGQPIHSTEEGIKNFWRWFDGSVMKNRKGQPCVFYHGTPYIFSESKFIPQQIIGQLEGDNAVFFSTNRVFSIDFAAERRDTDGEMKVNYPPEAIRSEDIKTYSVYLRCKKPFNFRNQKCIQEFMDYVKRVVPNSEDRINMNNNEKIRGFISGNAHYNYLYRPDEAKIGDIVNVQDHESAFKPTTKIGSIDGEEIPVEVTMLSYIHKNSIVFDDKDDYVLVYNLNPLKSGKVTSKDKILDKNSEIIEKIKKSSINLDKGTVKKIPTQIKIQHENGDIESVSVNIQVMKVFKNIDKSPILKFSSNWEEVETLVINNDLSYVRILKNLGYDSFFTFENKNLNIAVFNAKDIKSVDNDGTFSETDNFDH